MAFKTFTNKEELMKIIYSVSDTALVSDLQADFNLIESFGFKIDDNKYPIRCFGKTYVLVDDDCVIYISFSNPCKKNGICYMIQKQFFTNKHDVLLSHRSNSLPACITYHSNGMVYEERYRLYNEFYPILILENVEYSYLDSITTIKNKKEYIFKSQQWHAKILRVNPKTRKPLQIIYYHREQPQKMIDFDSIKKIYPAIVRLSYLERVNLKVNLSTSEQSLIEMLTF